MKREPWQPKHTLNLAVFTLALVAVVLLEIFAHGQHIDAVLGFAAGLLVPGSPLAALTGKS